MVSLAQPPGRGNECLGHEASSTRMLSYCQLSAMTILYIFKVSYMFKDHHNYSLILKRKVVLLIINGILKIIRETPQANKQKKNKGPSVDFSTMAIWFWN